MGAGFLAVSEDGSGSCSGVTHYDDDYNLSQKYLSMIFMQPSQTMPKEFSMGCSQRVTSRRYHCNQAKNRSAFQRRYRRRWTIEGLFAWLQIYRRLATRWEYHIENFFGMVRLEHFQGRCSASAKVGTGLPACPLSGRQECLPPPGAYTVTQKML